MPLEKRERRAETRRSLRPQPTTREVMPPYQNQPPFDISPGLPSGGRPDIEPGICFEQMRRREAESRETSEPRSKDRLAHHGRADASISSPFRSVKDRPDRRGAAICTAGPWSQTIKLLVASSGPGTPQEQNAASDPFSAYPGRRGRAYGDAADD